MASDGHIDNKEISMVKSLCEKLPMFENFNFPKNQVHTLTYTPMPSIKASASNSPSPTFSKKNESK
jgi:hypothetical protein